MVKCRKAGVPTPCIYYVETERYRICTEKILGVSYKDFLRSIDFGIAVFYRNYFEELFLSSLSELVMLFF